MVSVFLKKFTDLFYVGIDRSANLYEIRHILLLNIMVLVLNLFCFLMAALYYSEYRFLSWMLIFWSIIAWLVYFLNYRRRFLIAKLYFCITGLFLLIGLAVTAGLESNMQLFMLTTMILLFFVFNHKEKVYMITFISLLVISFLTFELSPQVESLRMTTAAEAFAVRYIIDGGVVLYTLLICFFCFYVINYTEKSLVAEQALSERLLLNILPEAIAKKLKTDPGMVAEKSSSGSVLFADIVGFTALTAAKTPEETVNMLNDIFSEFDDLIEEAGLEKIKTIGDAVMVAGGIPEYCEDHLERTVGLALAMQQKVQKEFNIKYGIDLRIGIDTGEIIAGIIGRKKFLYDLWGHTVNTASRMESNGLPGKIQVTERVYNRLNGDYLFECRGSIECKGMGQVNTYFLDARH